MKLSVFYKFLARFRQNSAQYMYAQVLSVYVNYLQVEALKVVPLQHRPRCNVRTSIIDTLPASVHHRTFLNGFKDYNKFKPPPSWQ
jgi:hypothetical protein